MQAKTGRTPKRRRRYPGHESQNPDRTSPEFFGKPILPRAEMKTNSLIRVITFEVGVMTIMKIIRSEVLAVIMSS